MACLTLGISTSFVLSAHFPRPTLDELLAGTILPPDARGITGPKIDRATSLARQYWAARGKDKNCQKGVRLYVAPTVEPLNRPNNVARAVSNCRIVFRQDFVQERSWYAFCFVTLHEWGHLQGQHHSQSDRTVMSSNPIEPQECTNLADEIIYSSQTGNGYEVHE